MFPLRRRSRANLTRCAGCYKTTGKSRRHVFRWTLAELESYEHVFVTAQGSPRTRFRRAIERRSLLNAELAAREMAVCDARGGAPACRAVREQADPRAERAMMRWLGRLFSEKQGPRSRRSAFSSLRTADVPSSYEKTIVLVVKLCPPVPSGMNSRTKTCSPAGSPDGKFVKKNFEMTRL